MECPFINTNVHFPEESDLPHSEGRIPIVDNPSATDGADATGRSELPPLPDEAQSLSDAFKRSKFMEQSSPSPEPMLPMEVPEFENTGSARASVGGISLNTTAWDFAPYLLDLKHRIKQHWIPPIAFTALGAISGYTVINFRIYPDGTMEAMEILESHGDSSEPVDSLQAVLSAAQIADMATSLRDIYLAPALRTYLLDS